MSRRVVLVLADGLRPDAITETDMPSLTALLRGGAWALNATTVRPSVTVAALGSLATGVSPATHGLVEPGLAFLRNLKSIQPVARVLEKHGLSTTVVVPEMGRTSYSIMRVLVRAAGVGRLVTGGKTPRAIATAVAQELDGLDAGLLVVYLADCDGAGHAHGWMSQRYMDAAGHVDAAIGQLSEHTDHPLLTVLSDHGGGGVAPRDHDMPHPVNDRIPVVFSGPRVRHGRPLPGPTSILDVPPTILWYLGASVPENYEGRVIREAFALPARTREVA